MLKWLMGCQQILPNAVCPIAEGMLGITLIIRHWPEMTFIAHMLLLLIPDEQSLIRRLETKILHRLELEPLGSNVKGETNPELGWQLKFVGIIIYFLNDLIRTSCSWH